MVLSLLDTDAGTESVDALLGEEKAKAAAQQAPAGEELSEGVAKLSVREAPERREEPRRFNTDKYPPPFPSAVN